MSSVSTTSSPSTPKTLAEAMATPPRPRRPIFGRSRAEYSQDMVRVHDSYMSSVGKPSPEVTPPLEAEVELATPLLPAKKPGLIQRLFEACRGARPGR